MRCENITSIGIYMITNLINGKKYIGLSTNPSQRFIQHRSKLRNNQHANTYFQEDWNEYGEENFYFYIISNNGDFETEKKFILKMNTRFERLGSRMVRPNTCNRNRRSKK